MDHLIYSKILVIFLFLLNLCVIFGAAVADAGVVNVQLNIAIIGAGPGGLFSAKHSLAHGHRVTVYEQSDAIGGVWVYTNQTGENQYGLNIHTAMYKGLRTNEPAPLMQVSDFPLPSDISPFPSQPDMLNYLHSYADHFGLNQHIKFNHLVIRVRTIENDRWEIIVHDLLNDKFITSVYDAVFVCNGHFFEPFVPNIEGAKEFKGKLLHSHDFRSAEKFQDDDVLVIGFGPSGIDVVMMLSNVKARSVSLSQRKSLANATKDELEKLKNALPNVIFKDQIKRFTVDGVEFSDGTHQTFTSIIYATGYKYSYPFLSVDSGIHVEQNFVQPLYKHIINIEHPTMAFIGIPTTLFPYPIMNLQAQAAIKWLSDEKKLPTKQEMMQDLHVNTKAHWAKGYTKWKTHYIIALEMEYLKTLETLCDIKHIPDVLYSIAHDSFQLFLNQPTEFRKYKYTVIDSSNFTRIKVD